MMWYLQSQRCHLSLSNHRGHPRLPEYSSDSLISISVILWFEQSHPLPVLLEKRRGVSPHSSVLTIVCFESSLFPASLLRRHTFPRFSVAFPCSFSLRRGRTPETVPYICPSAVTWMCHMSWIEISGWFSLSLEKCTPAHTRGCSRNLWCSLRD